MRVSKLNSLLILCYFLSIPIGLAQSKKLDKKHGKRKYNSGAIKFDDGTERRCDLYFDWGAGIVYEKNGKGILPHTAFKVVSFEFVDYKNENKLRRFYSLPYKNLEAGLPETFVFFEVLYEKSNLAILSFHYEEYKGEGATNQYGAPSAGATQYGSVLKVYDKVFLVRGNTGLKCLLEREGKLAGFWQEERTYNKVHSNVLEEIFKDDYNELLSYIESNDLNMKRVGDLIKAIKHYKDNI